MTKTELIIELNRLPETGALWHREDVLCFARYGSLGGRLRSAPESMKRVLKVVLGKLFALNKTGTDFDYQPERVDPDGFRPYFVQKDLMKWTGITCRATITNGLSWLAESGIITLRKSGQPGANGPASHVMLRLNPKVLIAIQRRVNALKKGGAQ